MAEGMNRRCLASSSMMLPERRKANSCSAALESSTFTPVVSNSTRFSIRLKNLAFTGSEKESATIRGRPRKLPSLAWHTMPGPHESMPMDSTDTFLAPMADNPCITSV